jgi:hypothetical protein
MNIAGYTLIDITETGVYRQHPENSLERNQQRNWETVLQIIGLRTQPVNIKPPNSPQLVSVANHQFGTFYKGSQMCWKFMFRIENSDVLGPEETPLLLLEKDFNEIPIITNLTETIGLPDSVFYTHGILKNIYFRILD